MNNINNPIKFLRLSILFLVLLVCSGSEILPSSVHAAPFIKSESLSTFVKQQTTAHLTESTSKDHDIVLCEEDVENEDDTISYLEQPYYLIAQQRFFTDCSIHHNLYKVSFSSTPLFILFRNLRI